MRRFSNVIPAQAGIQNGVASDQVGTLEHVLHKL
jgi:hypothetical protein